MSYIQNINSVFCRPYASGENFDWTKCVNLINSFLGYQGYSKNDIGNYDLIDDTIYFPDIIPSTSTDYIVLPSQLASNNGAPFAGPSGESWYMQSPYFQGNSNQVNLYIYYSQVYRGANPQTNRLTFTYKINNIWNTGIITGFKDLGTTYGSGIPRWYKYSFPYVGPSGHFANWQMGLSIDQLVASDSANPGGASGVAWLWGMYGEVVLDQGLPLYTTADVPSSGISLYSIGHSGLTDGTPLYTSGGSTSLTYEIPFYSLANTNSSGINLYVSGQLGTKSSGISLSISGQLGSGIGPIPFYTSGVVGAINSFPLYACNTLVLYNSSVQIPFYIQGPTPSTTGIPFTLWEIYGEQTAPLYTFGVYKADSGFPLSISGANTVTTTHPFYLKGPDWTGVSGGVPFYTRTSADGLSSSFNASGGVPLYVGTSGPSGTFTFNLYLKGSPVGSSLYMTPLYLHNPSSGSLLNSVPFYVNNTYSGVYNSVPLYVVNKRNLSIFDPLYFELEDGAIPLDVAHPFYISAGQGKNIPFYLKNTQGSSVLGVPLNIGSAYANTSGVKFYTSAIGGQAGSIKIFTHGY